MSKEYKYPPDGWRLVRVKRDWCPEWLFAFLAPVVWFFPLNVIFTKKVDE